MHSLKPLKGLLEFFKKKTKDYAEWDVKEKEALFYLILFSPLYGVPIVSPLSVFELLPHIIKDLKRNMEREKQTESSLWKLLGILGIE